MALPGVQVAITLDDLPWVGRLPNGESDANAALDRIAAVLRVHQAPAVGFVVCDHAVGDEAPLRTWAAWGNRLGNHSASHLDLNRNTVEAWTEDVRRCDEYLQRFGEAVVPYFRFPLLHQGDTEEKRHGARAALDALGLRTAHVTVDNSEWILARAQAHALATGDAVLRREIGDAFVGHVLAAVAHADGVARRKLGRPVPQVLLLHANALVDDHLDALLLALAAQGVEFIALEEALDDPAYARSDEYVGPRGLSWLYRMQPLSVEDSAWDDAEAEAIRSRFAGALAAAGSPSVPERSVRPYLSPIAPDGFEPILEQAASSERMRSLLVAHRGQLVVDAYFNGAGPQTPANLKPVTKSLTSALIGVALREGWIESLDDPIGKYLSPDGDAGSAPLAVTLRALLTMSSGSRPVGYGAIQQSADWVGMLLDQPVGEDAGRFVYDTPVLQLLSAVLQAASGLSPSEIARRELLAPIGAELAHWRRDAQGLELGGNDAYLRPRDLLRLGELYRRGGDLDGRRVLPAGYVEQSTAVQISPSTERVNHDTLAVRGYGYLWWLLDLDGEPAYAALGHGGQILLVVPRRELTVVMTSRWPSASSTEHYQHLTRLLMESILPRFPAP